MAKSSISKLHLNQDLHSHYMSKGNPTEDHLTVFKEIVANLKTLNFHPNF